MPMYRIEKTYLLTFEVEGDSEDDAMAKVESLYGGAIGHYMNDHAELESFVIEEV